MTRANAPASIHLGNVGPAKYVMQIPTALKRRRCSSVSGNVVYMVFQQYGKIVKTTVFVGRPQRQGEDSNQESF